MARITVEDCLENTENRFELILLAAKRARQLSRGALPLVDEEDDKPTVLALREIASGKVSPSLLNEDDDEGSLDDPSFYAQATIDPHTTEGNDVRPEGSDELPDEESAEKRFMEEMERTLGMEVPEEMETTVEHDRSASDEKSAGEASELSDNSET